MDSSLDTTGLFPSYAPLEDTIGLQNFVECCGNIMYRVYCTMAFNVQENRMFDPLPLRYGIQTLDLPLNFYYDCAIDLIQHGTHGNGMTYGEGDEVFFALASPQDWGTSNEKSIKMPTPDPKSYMPPISPTRFLMDNPELYRWLVGVWDAQSLYHEHKEAHYWDKVEDAVYITYLVNIKFKPHFDTQLSESTLNQLAVRYTIEEGNYWLDVDKDIRNILGHAFIPDWDEVKDFGHEESDNDDEAVPVNGNVGWLDADDFEEEEWDDTDEVRESRASWAQGFVASLEKVDLHEIPIDDRRCPGCWADFGETDEFHELYEAPPLPEDADEAETIILFEALPFDARRPNNDAVRTTCGHLFGYDCLAESLAANSLCPICRVELRERAADN